MYLEFATTTLQDHLDKHVQEGAVLAQYPLQGSCIVKHPVSATNDSKLKNRCIGSGAKRIKTVYLISAISKRTCKFLLLSIMPWLCRTVNKRIEYIEICKAIFSDTSQLKHFFMLTSGIV